ncbi:hypothetical protein V7201_02660 [Bacillus sp. JJ1122]|uniref:hypothetical protein n=1 Tax=Bacillus sp. JJ1122 TaxID=3122951 RepID=UPI002FFD6367
MQRLSRIALPLIAIFTMAACTPFSDGCPDAAISWRDVLKINDILYQHDFVEEPEGFTPAKGKEIGKVSYQMADNACSGHKTRNGDAAFLPKGTEIYEVKGYPSSLMVTAGGRVFVVDERKEAKNGSDLYPVQDKVKNIIFRSTEDDTIIHTFSKEAINSFLKEWQAAEVYDRQKFANEKTSESERVFIGVELENGIVFRVTYWSDKNFFSDGTKGTPELQKVIKDELAKVK